MSRVMFNHLDPGPDGPPSGLVSDLFRLCHGTYKNDYSDTFVDRKIFEK